MIPKHLAYTCYLLWSSFLSTSESGADHFGYSRGALPDTSVNRVRVATSLNVDSESGSSDAESRNGTIPNFPLSPPTDYILLHIFTIGEVVF